jgi:LmbE family N-acetylglucosaminyl deacetylase
MKNAFLTGCIRRSDLNLHIPTSELYIPDGTPVDDAVARTTHMAVCAHQDDIEIAAYHGILECFQREDRAFMGVVVTNGAGSPRDNLYAHYTDEDMQKVRRVEQKKAAVVGEYCAQAFLDYTSAQVKDASNADVIDDIKRLVDAARPEVVYTHNLADKHDTHIAVALRTIRAIRELPAQDRPKKLLGCEVWRDLDWLTDDDKTVLDVGAHENLAAALLGVFDSQICGGKRYDLATMGRRRAHATYHASHGTDVTTSLTFAMDLTPLVRDDSLDPGEYAGGFVRRFSEEVLSRIGKLT